MTSANNVLHAPIVPVDSTVALAVNALTVTLADCVVLEDVSLRLMPGEMLAVMGPNGAGKTSLLRACLGLVRCQAGAVQVFGSAPRKALRRTAYLPQSSRLDWRAPVSLRDLVRTGLYRQTPWCRPIDRAARDRADARMAMLGLTPLAKRRIGTLSGGERQRALLARALVQDADLLLLDEPFAAIDPASLATVMDVLAAERARGAAILCVHHEPASADPLFDRAIALNHRVMAQGSAAACRAALLSQAADTHPAAAAGQRRRA